MVLRRHGAEGTAGDQQDTTRGEEGPETSTTSVRRNVDRCSSAQAGIRAVYGSMDSVTQVFQDKLFTMFWYLPGIAGV